MGIIPGEADVTGHMIRIEFDRSFERPEHAAGQHALLHEIHFIHALRQGDPEARLEGGVLGVKLRRPVEEFDRLFRAFLPQSNVAQ